MPNTEIYYMYRDADNYKKHNIQILSGLCLPEYEARIRATLKDGEYFIPSVVGLPEDKYSGSDADHDFFEFCGIKETNAPASLSLTIEEVVKRMESVKDWENP